MDDEQKATSALSAMINGRSEALLAPTVASSQISAPNGQSGETEEAIRRRKLQLAQAPGSDPPSNSSLPTEMTSAGGFLHPGEANFDAAKLAYRPGLNSVSRFDSDEDVLGTQSLVASGATSNGITSITAQAPAEELRPRKKLMRARDLEARNSRESSLGPEEASPDAISPIASGSSTPNISAELSHVQLNRANSSTANLHGPSGLSSGTIVNAESQTQSTQPVANTGADTEIARQASTSPVVGRRRKATKKIVEDDDDSESDAYEPDEADEDDEDEYIPDDEEKPEKLKSPYKAQTPQAMYGTQPQRPPSTMAYAAQSMYPQQPYSMAPAPRPYIQASPFAQSPFYPQASANPAMPSTSMGSMGISPAALTQTSQPSQGQAQIMSNLQQTYQLFRQKFANLPDAFVSQAWNAGQGSVERASAHIHQWMTSATPEQLSQLKAMANGTSQSPQAQYAGAQQSPQTTGARQMYGGMSPPAGFPQVVSPGSQGVSPMAFAPQQGSQSPFQQRSQTPMTQAPTYIAAAQGQAPMGVSMQSPQQMQQQKQSPREKMTMPALSASQVQWLFVNIKPKLPPDLQAKVSTMAAPQQLTFLYTWFQNQQRQGTQQVQQQQQWQQQPVRGQPMAPGPPGAQYNQFPQQGAASGQNRFGQMSTVMRPAHPFAQHTATYKSASSQQQYQQQQQQMLFKKKRKAVDSDESDAGYSDDEGGHNDRYLERDRAKTESGALAWFNDRSAQELQDLTSCTNAQVKLVVEMRPFASVEDVRIKLKKTKGVSANLFDNFVDIMQAYTAVDKVFASCRAIGSELDRVMAIWKSASTKKDKTPIPTRVGTPDLDQVDEAAGVHITQIDENAVAETLESKHTSPEVREAFQGYLQKQPAGIPESIRLKAYQMLGVNWLLLLYRKGHSCILADEMGLGKTCQIIAFLSHLKSIGKSGPHLIIVPSSTLENWLREFSIFAPELKIASYYGSQREREELRDDIRENIKEGGIDVVVTTYNLAAGQPDDRKFLRKCKFKTCTYDEGHQLKNSESKKHKDLMAIDVPWRCLLTGTPLQNNLTELISLLAFILPDVIGAAQEELRAIFKVGPGNQSSMLSRHRINSAKSIMTPFVLRRKKMQVLQDLPSKNARLEICTLTPLQRECYRDAIQRSKKMLFASEKNAADEDEAIAEAVAEEEAEENMVAKAKDEGKRGFTKKGVLRVQQNSSANVLMDLRKAANHPMLFRRHYSDETIRAMSKDCLREFEFADRNPNLIYEDMDVMTDFELHRFVQPYEKLREKYSLKQEEWMDSAKVVALKKLLPECLDKGDRVLLFSQFTQVLDILEAVLNTMGIRWLKLTGQTSVVERQSIVDEFYADEDIGVFLLSTRAGGLGLNLAAASVVILHDQDFNPHNDRQAEDRAWRIGQTKDVQVIRLICKGTIEEDIYALAQTKLELDKEVTMDIASGDVPLEETPSEPTNVTAASLAGAPAKGAKKGRKTKAEKEAAAAGGAATEGDEAAVAKRMSKGLLSRLRDRFEREEQGLDTGAVQEDAEDEKPDAVATEDEPTADATEAKQETAMDEV